MRVVILLYLLSLLNSTNAQISDSFNTGNLNNWQGDKAKFILENSKLRSNSTAANDQFYLSQPSSDDNKEWQLDLELKFNTSSVNYVDFIIASNTNNFSDSLTYIRVGNTKDEISLYQKKSNTTLLIDGLDEVTKKSNNTLILRARVIKDTLLLDYATSYNAPRTFEKLLKTQIDTHSLKFSANYMGLRIRQSTASFFGDHYFNYLYAGKLITDTSKPQIKNLTVIDSNTLGLLFSEPIKLNLLNKLSNFKINSISPININLINQDSIELNFLNTFISGKQEQIIIDSLSDLLGNTSRNLLVPFTFFDVRNANYKDLIITEIYSKPLSTSLNVEAVELFNNTNHYINVGNLIYADLTGTESFPSQTLAPKSYYVLCDDDDTALFSNSIALKTMPTLNDSRDLVNIIDNSNQLIGQVLYESSWHIPGKEDGGWSLEMINSDNGCYNEYNFSSSINNNGHTLGKVNSIESNKNSPNALLERLFINQAQRLELYFTHALGYDVIMQNGFFSITPNIAIDTIIIDKENPSHLSIVLKQPIIGKSEITIKEHTQCNGQIQKKQTMEFGIGLQPQATHLQITELMFNAGSNCSEYIEIQNTSTHFISLRNMLMGHASSTKNEQFNLTEGNYMLAPNQMAVLVQDFKSFNSCYQPCPNSLIIEIDDWETLSDDAGTIWLKNAQNVLVDSIYYDKEFHSALLNDDDGVALEKLDTNQSGLNGNVWASVGEDKNYAQPGCQNQFAQNTTSTDAFSLAHPYFGNTANPKAGVKYQFKNGVYQISIYIVDKRGLIVKQLANNSTVSKNGVIYWDGVSQDGKNAAIGIYFVKIIAISDLGDQLNSILELTKVK